MFSGIVEELGEVKNISRRGNITLLEIAARKILEGTKTGDSIAVNGACLTVTDRRESTLLFEIMPQTIEITNLGLLRISNKVNLERSLKIGDRVSGHFVTGHIDCMGAIRKKNYSGGNLCFEISTPAQFISYILPKGSVALDGISLTIVDRKSGNLRVYIIPHTLKNTTLGFKGPSDKVNVEFDIIAKRLTTK